MERIFERGYSTKVEKGRGIGLYTVRKILRKYDGRISAEVNKNIFKVTVEIPKHKFA